MTPKADAKPDAPKHTLDRAYTQLDKLTREQGAQQKVDAVKLDACIAKQDTSAIEASKQLGTTLNIESTPTFYINGEKFEGAAPHRLHLRPDRRRPPRRERHPAPTLRSPRASG